MVMIEIRDIDGYLIHTAHNAETREDAVMSAACHGVGLEYAHSVTVQIVEPRLIVGDRVLVTLTDGTRVEGYVEAAGTRLFASTGDWWLVVRGPDGTPPESVASVERVPIGVPVGDWARSGDAGPHVQQSTYTGDAS